MPEFVTVEVSDAIATIRIDRPPVNALDATAQRELVAAAAEVSHRADVDAVIVTGGDKVFAAGDDIAELAQLRPGDAPAIAAEVQAALGCLTTIQQPTVAAISGYALGGGLELALGCDRRIIGDNVKLGLPEILLGVIPVGGGTQRLAALIGPGAAKDLIYTGRFVGATEASELGLVDQVVPPDEVYAAARRWAVQFVGGPRRALAAAKAAVDAGLLDPASGYRTERELFAALCDTDDMREGVRSFLAAGPGRARFTGR